MEYQSLIKNWFRLMPIDADKAIDKIKKIAEKVKLSGIQSLLLKNSYLSFLISIIGTGIAFFTQAFLSRVLGKEEYGIYIYTLTLISTLTIFTNLGWDTLLIKYVAAYSSTEQWGKLKGILLYSRKISMANSALIAGAGLTISWLLGLSLASNQGKSLLIGFILLPLLSLLRLYASSLKGLKRIPASQAPNLIFRNIFLLLTVLVFSEFILDEPESHFIMAADLFAVFLSIILIHRFHQKGLPSQVDLHKSEYERKYWFITAFPLFIISGMNMILNRTDIIMLGAMLNTTQAGIYSVASRISTLILFGLNAVNSISAPLIAQLYALHDKEELQKTVMLSTRLIFVVTLPITILICLFGNQVLDLFGSDFETGYLALIILSIGQSINAFSGSVGFLMTMTGHQKEAAIVLCICALLNISLNFLMIPIWGLRGAAIATSITNVIWNLSLSIYCQRKLSIKTTIL